MSRLECEFGECPCRLHKGGTDKCGVCLHAACWHKRGVWTGQFASQRQAARKPSYFRVQVLTPTMPEVPPLPGDYCPTVAPV